MPTNLMHSEHGGSGDTMEQNKQKLIRYNNTRSEGMKIDENLTLPTMDDSENEPSARSYEICATTSWLASRLGCGRESGSGGEWKNVSAPTDGTVLVLDCRSPTEFGASHIAGSLNVTLPSILFKRLLKGTLSASLAIAAKDTREWFLDNSHSVTVILVPESGSAAPTLSSLSAGWGSPSVSTPSPLPTAASPMTTGDEPMPGAKLLSRQDLNGNIKTVSSASAHSLSSLLLKRFQADGSPALLLKEEKFLETSDTPCGDSKLSQSPSDNPLSLPGINNAARPSQLGPLFSLQGLNLEEGGSSSGNSSGSDSCFSSPSSSCKTQMKEPLHAHQLHLHSLPQHPLPPLLDPIPSYKKLNGRQSENQFPVEILPHLYLGNAHNAADKSTLKKYGIKYVLNVTPNLPNSFEEDEDFHYLQIPINDHWSQNLAAHFPSAIAFIEEARRQECGVLVHCLAGISRSVTVTVAYLMQTMHKSLDDAYELVKEQKPNIAPNFNFMGQLLDFERQLNGGTPENDSGRSSASSADDPCPPPPRPHADPHTHFMSPTLTLAPPPFGKRSRHPTPSQLPL